MTSETHKELGAAYAKRRNLWQFSSIRLLREASWAAYARGAVPPVVNGTKIEFPETITSFGWEITSWTSRMEGAPLLALLYHPGSEADALRIGMTVLDAFHMADLRAVPGGLFGRAFRVFRSLRMLRRASSRTSPMSEAEKVELRQLIRRYVLNRPERRVLVHGDLHASHVLVQPSGDIVAIIDLEAMHVGKAATNFAQMWIGFHYVDAALGRRFFDRYAEKYGAEMDAQFDNDVRLELAMRGYSHMRVGRQNGNLVLAENGALLLHLALSGQSFRSVCGGGKL